MPITTFSNENESNEDKPDEEHADQMNIRLRDWRVAPYIQQENEKNEEEEDDELQSK